MMSYVLHFSKYKIVFLSLLCHKTEYDSSPSALPQKESLAMPEAVPVSGRVRKPEGIWTRK